MYKKRSIFMKYIVKNKKYIISSVVLLGILTLLFFPEPETNFIFYLATALLFIAVTVAIMLVSKK